MFLSHTWVLVSSRNGYLDTKLAITWLKMAQKWPTLIEALSSNPGLILISEGVLNRLLALGTILVGPMLRLNLPKLTLRTPT